MEGELRGRVASGMAWTLAEKAGSMLLQTGVGILVARLLVPEDYGVMAILTVFATLSLVVVDSGFSQTLIRKEEPTAADYNSVFRFNIAVSLLLYGALAAVTPWLADFYGQPVLRQLAPVLFLLLPLNALCVIQQTLYTRRFRFAPLSKIVFASTACGGISAVLMAWSGCGVWSLVGQRLAAMGSKALLLWVFGGWRPGRSFDGGALRAMAPYSLRLMATDFISTLYNNISQLFVGKIYSTQTLGYFNQGQKLKELPVASLMQSVQNVTFPALSKIKEDAAKFAESYRQLMLTVSFFVFPVMTGLIAVADELFALLLGEKWMPTVPYFEVLCLAGLFMPLSTIAYNVLKVRSDGSVIVRLEVVKKGIMTLILAVSIPHSVMAVAWGIVTMAACELTLNLWATRRFTTLPLRRLTGALLPAALLSGAMFAAVKLAATLLTSPISLLSSPLALPLPLRLAALVLTGITAYGGLALLFRTEALHIALQLLRRLKE